MIDFFRERSNLLPLDSPFTAAGYAGSYYSHCAGKHPLLADLGHIACNLKTGRQRQVHRRRAGHHANLPRFDDPAHVPIEKPQIG